MEYYTANIMRVIYSYRLFICNLNDEKISNDNKKLCKYTIEISYLIIYVIYANINSCIIYFCFIYLYINSVLTTCFKSSLYK